MINNAPDPNTALRRAAVLQLLAAAAIIIHDEIITAQRRRAHRRMWSRGWLLRRPIRGQYTKLMDKLHSEDQSGFRNYLRITPAVFKDLLRLIGPHIHKSGCNVRAPLPAGLRLAVTLRYLATGASYHDLMCIFRV